MSSRAGVIRAEGEVVSSAGSTDRIVVQQFNSNGGFYEPKEITVANLFTGSGAKAGQATLTAGTVTVSNTSVTANSLIFLSRSDVGASTEAGTLTVGTVTAGTSFVISALDPSDASVATGDISVVNWMLIEPSA